MTRTIYVEGGGDSKELHTRCREAFTRLFEGCGFSGRMPRFFACGSREDAFDDFRTAHCLSSRDAYVCMLIDSEDPVADINQPWTHLKQRDGWDKPESADDGQVFLMVTCMETWIVADPGGLRHHYKQHLQQSALPPVSALELRDRHEIQNSLAHATRKCQNAYKKGKRSFEVLGRLSPEELKKNLPSFARMISILDERL